MAYFATLIGLITLFFHMNSQAFASNPPKQYRLFGRGIENRNTGERIVLACVGPEESDHALGSCQILQHLYFESGQGVPKFIGGRFKSSMKEIRKQFKRSQKRELKYRIKRFIEEREEAVIFLMIGGVMASWFTGPAMGIAFGTVTGAGFFTLFNGPTLFSSGLGFGQAKTFVLALDDQNGWNWIELPERVRGKKFNAYWSWASSSTNLIQHPL